jgi:hypothetical protein
VVVLGRTTLMPFGFLSVSRVVRIIGIMMKKIGTVGGNLLLRILVFAYAEILIKRAEQKLIYPAHIL